MCCKMESTLLHLGTDCTLCDGGEVYMFNDYIYFSTVYTLLGIPDREHSSEMQ
jgi:hypothetical protein